MIYMKHPDLGNSYLDEGEQTERESAGWVRWPRTKDQKSRVSVPPPREAEVVASPPLPPLPDSGGTPKRGPGRPRKEP